MTARFELLGREFLALNAHPHQPFTEAISFSIEVDSQDEIDYYWRALTADGGKESMCGWLKDKFGLSWQVIPKALVRYLSDNDRARADRVMRAMLKMRKIVIADLDKAYAG
jgi:predicted 3-demethylubiquinone-9 3-methyltransferase (glyoxalase superfamily)